MTARQDAFNMRVAELQDGSSLIDEDTAKIIASLQLSKASKLYNPPDDLFDTPEERKRRLERERENAAKLAAAEAAWRAKKNKTVAGAVKEGLKEDVPAPEKASFRKPTGRKPTGHKF